MCSLMCTDTLYVILPYFNYCGFKKRKSLFVDFVKRIQNLQGIKIIIAENGKSLPNLNVHKHFKFKVEHKLWIKENLINMATNLLPKNWKCMAWIDADITFLNTRWVKDTLKSLRTYDVVQLFQTAVNLGPNGESLKIDKSFGYMHDKSGTPYVKSDKYGFWHPGYAWAIRREAWDKMGGLIDWAILGSADRHMALAWIGKVMSSCPGNIHENYKALLQEYEITCRGFKLSCIDGTILHHWHGSLENRKYKERWDILTKNKFDPLIDLITSKSCISLSESGLRLEKEIMDYFSERKEDD